MLTRVACRFIPSSLRSQAKDLDEEVLEEGREYARVWDTPDDEVSEKRGLKLSSVLFFTVAFSPYRNAIGQS